jgi:hypothetical protein
MCTESCDGAHTITACVGGAPVPIDCKDYGFNACDTSSPLNNSSQTFAFCFY